MIFEITPDHIERLSDTDLRTLIGFLAEQEVVCAGQSASGVTYGGNQNAPDGGIDVRVDLGNAQIEGYVPRPQTGFQSKAEDMPESSIRDEMRPNGKLRQSILELGKAGGAYVIVSSKSNVSDIFLTKRKNAMAAAIADESEASGLHLDFYDRQKLTSWINQHPGLIPWVRERVGLPLSGWRPFEDWSSSPETLDKPYLLDNHIRLYSSSHENSSGMDGTSGINKIREILKKPKGAVRLVGLSGVGKTRFAQALFDSTIGSNALSPHLAIYTDMSHSPSPLPMELLIHLQNLGQQCVLIVDNCGVKLHRELVARMANADRSVSLLTIEYDISDDEPEHSDTFKLEPSSGEIVEKIIQRKYPSLAAPEIQTISAFSEGNARIALALASTAQSGESLANLKDSDLVKRLFWQNNQEDQNLWKAAKAFSLVYSFDGETIDGDNAELPKLAALTGIGVSDLHAHHAILHRRQLIQKRAQWRAVLPHALAHRLAKEALQDFHRENLLSNLSENAPERLLLSFSRRLGYLHDSKEAQEIVKNWLSTSGWLEKIEDLNQTGITVLQNIAPVNPAAVLDSIAASMQRNPTALQTQHTKIVPLLRSLAYEPALFHKATMLVAAFTEKVEETNSVSDSRNIFKSLFYIYLSGTHATAEQRANLLREIAKSKMGNRVELVLSGLDSMLECSNWTSGYSFEFGTRRRDYGLHPNTADEYMNWYQETFNLANDLTKIDGFRDSVRKMISSQFRQLAAHPILTDALIALADKFIKDGGWPEGWVGARSAVKKSKRKKRKEDTKKFQALADRLAPQSLQEKIASYVLPEQLGALDIIEVDFDDEKKYEKALKYIENICDDLGKEIADNMDVLKAVLPAMLLANSERVWYVGRAIGRYTKNWQIAWDTIVAQTIQPGLTGKTYNFLPAFLVGLAERDKKSANDLVEKSLLSESLHPYFIWLQTSVGIDINSFERVARAVSILTIPINTFISLGHGRASDNLPSDAFRKMILSIAQRNGGVEVAIDVFHMRLFSEANKTEELELEEKKTGKILLGMVDFEKRNKDDSYHLSRIVRKCLTAPLDEPIAENLCKRLMEGISQYKVYAMDYGELVDELAKLFPRAVLNILVEGTTDKQEGRRNIFSSLGSSRSCSLKNLPEDEVLKWAHERPETRFIHLSESIRPWQIKGVATNDNPSDDTIGNLEWTSLALRLLNESPNPFEILQQYIESFRPSCYSPPLSAILEARIPLLEFLTNNLNASIANAAKQSLSLYRENIIRQKDWEIRHDRERDERFEW